MIQTAIALVFAAILILVAWRADARFRQWQRLPMQWTLTGSVTWTAPRRIALALIPALAIPILAAIAATIGRVPPRAGQEGLEIPVLLLTGAVFVAVQWLHLRLVARQVRRDGD